MSDIELQHTASLEQTIADIAEAKVHLFCAKHFYTPSKFSKPVSGCVECWKAWYFTMWAKTPPDQRAEFLDGIEAGVHHAAELIHAGKWDYKPSLDVNIENVPDEKYNPNE